MIKNSRCIVITKLIYLIMYDNILDRYITADVFYVNMGEFNTIIIVTAFDNVMFMCVCVFVCVCVCVCVYMYTNTYKHTHTHTYTYTYAYKRVYIYIYIYIYIYTITLPRILIYKNVFYK